MLSLKHPSPEVKPASREGCILTLLRGTGGLGKGMLLVKAYFSEVVNPLLREAIIFITFCKPSFVKCSPLCIIATASLNNR